MRRTKIVATLGPACNTEEMVRKLLAAGVDVFRLNFSHGRSEDRIRLIEMIRQVSSSMDRFVPIVADIQGPKLRIGDVEGTVYLKEGATFVITTDLVPGNGLQVSTPFSRLPEEVQPGHRILINDGLVELKVTAVDPTHVQMLVIHGGPISSKKGMNFPDSELSIPAITPKDREDLTFVCQQQLDYVAASFVRKREDIQELRQILRSSGGEEISIIAKLEKAQAIDSLEAIIEESDGVMVARGDLGVELPPELVPIIQKRILKSASQWGKFAITATQMLESMTSNSRPTRAEASDVANAIFDGSDAVMLSAETASGAYPVESVEMMSRIVVAAEQNRQLQLQHTRDPFRKSTEVDEFTDALAGAANYAAEQIDAKYIVVFTQTGLAVRLMSKFRPRAPIIGMGQSMRVARRMGILWGVIPLVVENTGEFHEQIVEKVEEVLMSKGMVRPGDRIVILMGSPIYQRSRTNLLRVHQIKG
ncbi:MAG TPA: pyruvate kinase [Thermoanaerobaculia bacterium]|nr:pyruvate kinase [Thermoanaerobaculia bacterium]